jgi:hypothetical protein
MTAPPVHDFYTHLTVTAHRHYRNAKTDLPVRFNADRPETLVVDCRDGEVWPLPRWWLRDARHSEVGYGIPLQGSGWLATARRWNPDTVRLDLDRPGRPPFGAFVNVAALDELERMLSALVTARVEHLLLVCDWDAEAAALCGSPRTRCPTCRERVRGLLAGCRRPDCLKAELDEDRRIDFPSKD